MLIKEVTNLPKELQVCVYAICKNESQFIDRFMHSMSEADLVVVLDTGSNDDSVEKLRKQNAYVKQEIISPWRFDVARNKALGLIPEHIDICVSVDLDEFFSPGWCETLKKAWTPQTHSAKCRHVWSFNADGSEGGVFWPIRIHTRHNYIWTHAIHEVLHYTGETPENTLTLSNVQLNHHPDPHKSRGQYLTMLEQAVKDNPNDERDCFYLGREYMYHGKWQQCIATFKTYLSIPHALWRDERCAAMRFMAKSYLQLNEKQAAITYLEKAIEEAPYLREPFVDLAYLYYYDQDWEKCAKYSTLALQILKPSEGYINEPQAWDATPYDLGSIAYFNLKNYDRALAYAAKALSLAPTNTRIANNVKLIQSYVLHSISLNFTLSI